MSILFPRLARLMLCLCVSICGIAIQVSGQEARPRKTVTTPPPAPPLERPIRLVKPVIFTPSSSPVSETNPNNSGARANRPTSNNSTRTIVPDDAPVISADRNGLSPNVRAYVPPAAANGDSRNRTAADNNAVAARNLRVPNVGATTATLALKQMLQRRMITAIGARLGARYVFGSSGPRTFDCSGFVWSVFREAGYNFERASARSYWMNFEPAVGDERFEFGTLVLLNGLGHIGIVVDENGFYHASSSKGVTYSNFDEYWTKRIVGFRRVPLALLSEELLQQLETDTQIR